MDPSGFIASLRGRLRRVLIIEGVARTCAAGLLICCLVVLVDWIWPMPAVFRLAALGGLGACLVNVVRRRLHSPLSRRMDDRTLAGLVERRLPALDGRLLSGVDGIALSENDRQALRGLLSPAAASGMVPARALPRSLAIAGALAALVACVALLSPGFMRDALNRLFLPLGGHEWERKTTLVGRLERAVVPADEPLVVEMRREKQHASVSEHPLRLSWEELHGLRPLEARTLDGVAGPWRQPLSLPPGTYRLIAESGDARAYRLEGRVVSRPSIAQVTATLTPPAYTGNRPEILPTLTCSALPGSRLDFTIAFALETDRTIAQAALTLAGETVAITRDGSTLQGSIAVTRSGELLIRLVDQDGIAPKPEPRFALSLAEDRAPLVALDGPRNNEAVGVRAVLVVKVDARDDYGLAELTLLGQVEEPPAPSPGPEAAPAVVPPAQERELARFPEVAGYATTRPYRLTIAGLAAVGQRLQLVGQARDANDVTGPGVGRSEPLVLRVVSEEELRQEFDRLLTDARDRVTKAREEMARGLAKPEQLAPGSRNALLAARKAGELLDQVARRLRDNQMPGERTEAVDKAGGLVNQEALPKLAEVPTGGAKADAQARAADASLGEAERLLQGLLQEGDLSRLLSSVLDKERSLAEETRAFVLDSVGKPLDEAGKTRQANLAERQKELAAQMKDIERRLFSAEKGAQVAEAQELVRTEQPADRLFQAGAQLASPDQRTKANEHQKAAIATMEKLLEKLRGGDAAKGLAEQAGALAHRQEALAKEAEQGGDPKPLADAQRALEKDTEKLRKQVEEQGKSPEAAKDLAAAGQSQQSAAGEMGKGSNPGAAREAGAAASQLREAQRKLQGQEKEQEKPDAKKKTDPDVLRLLKELRTLQTKVVTDSTPLHLRLGEKALDFAGQRDLKEIAELQREILLRLGEEGIKELDGHAIALAALKRVALVMEKAAGHLELPALGAKGMRLEKSALQELSRLIDIAENLPQPEAGEEGGEGQGGKGGKQAPFPPAAELALLAAMEQDLAQRTAANHPADLAAQQREILALVELLEKHSRPGSRPAMLLQRTGRAMASSAYLLGQKDRGLTTRHEQEAAVASLRRMLAEQKAGGGGGEGGGQPPQDRQDGGSPPPPAGGQQSPAGGGNPAAGPAASSTAKTVPDAQRVHVDPSGVLMILPPERREQLREARTQNLPPAALRLYERYLEMLEDKE